MTKQIPVGKSGLLSIVDDEDYSNLIEFKWHPAHDTKGRTIYAQCNIKINNKWTTRKMHQLITGYKITDHINHNGLDNRRSNLRAATDSQNNANRFKQNGIYHSKYKGVTRKKQNIKWIAQIRVNKQLKRIGTFDNEIDAAKAYDAAARKYFGKFAYCNFEE